MPSVMAQDQISENLSGTAEDLEAQVTEGLAVRIPHLDLQQHIPYMEVHG